MTPTTDNAYSPFTSSLERLAWRVSMASLVVLLVFMIGLWE
jgi:hypothetical protein